MKRFLKKHFFTSPGRNVKVLSYAVTAIVITATIGLCFAILVWALAFSESVLEAIEGIALIIPTAAVGLLLAWAFSVPLYTLGDVSERLEKLENKHKDE
ncbi:MAG: hypothetical protein IJ426_03205 [Clostridia bacterium]|nr:hypothetical protein [Clostridia bacterium]